MLLHKTKSKPSDKAMDFSEAIIREAADRLGEFDLEFFKEYRQGVFNEFNQLDFPSRKKEDWKYFDFQDIFNQEYIYNPDKQSNLSEQELAQIVDKYVFRETTNNLLVTVNGIYNKKLSNVSSQTKGLKLLNLEELKNLQDKKILENINNSFSSFPSSYFRRVNTLLLQNLFILYLEKNIEIKDSLQVLHICDRNHFNQIRSVIYAEPNSKMDIIVTYVGLEDSKYFSNSVIDCFMEEGAKVKLEKIQNDGKEAISFYRLNAKQKKDSEFSFSSFSFGGQSSRDDVQVDLEGTGAHCQVSGLYVMNDKRKSHHKVTVNHASPHCTSSQLYKGLLKDQARAEFNGLIEVGRNATQTNADQLNKNLLLSEQAHMDSRPQLNILTDDVKCSHGSTVGKLDPEELFYLNSRGIGKDNAAAILTYSFCKEVIDKLKLKSVRNYASNLAFNNLKDNKDTSNILNDLAGNSKFKKSRYQ